MTSETAFCVTETMDEILRDGGLDHEMIEALVMQSLSTDEETVEVDSVPLSMTGRGSVLRTGVLVVNGTELGFQVSRDVGEDDVVRIIVRVEELQGVSAFSDEPSHEFTESETQTADLSDEFSD